MNSSPAQRLMSRRTLTLLPTATSLLHPEVVEGVDEQIKQKKQKAKYYHDRTAKILPEVEVGQEVRVAPTERNKPWKSATCVQKLSDCSYLVKTSKETVRRNRQSLKAAPPLQSAMSHPILHSHSVDEVIQASPGAANATSPALQQSVIKPQSITCSQEKTPVASTLLKVTRTRTRVVRPSS